MTFAATIQRGLFVHQCANVSRAKKRPRRRWTNRGPSSPSLNQGGSTSGLPTNSIPPGMATLR